MSTLPIDQAPLPGPPARVAIVEDVDDVREGLAALINGSREFRCDATFRTVEEALAALEADPPDVVLVDLGLPGMSGTDGIRVLRKRHPELSILALTVYADNDHIFEALCAGASGYLLKNTPPDRLIASLREVASGGAPMSPEVAHRVIRLFREFRPPERASHALTPQEQEILKLLVEGHSYKTAAAHLGISASTVSFHLQNIYGKLEVHSKTEAVAKALRQKLV